MNNKYDFDLYSFGLRLKKIREFYNYTQEQLAEELDISLKSVQNWENGKKMPGIDNIVNLARCYNMAVGEILEDEPYRIWNKKKDSRKRSIEILEAPDKIEVYIEITEDRYYDRYEVWVFDEIARQKYMWTSMQKVISFEEIKEVVLNQSEEIVRDYREWLFSILTDDEKDISIKEQIKGKMRCEAAGITAPGAVCVNGITGSIVYFDFGLDDLHEEE